MSRNLYRSWRTQVGLKSRLVLFALCAASIPNSGLCQQDVHASLLPKAARKQAPAFRLMDEKGKPTEVSSYRGRVVLLNFWATTCGGCVLEIPSFVELERSYGERGFTAVGVSAEIPYEGVKTPEEAWRRVRPFIARHHLNYPVLMGTPATVDSYGFNAYPATFLLDKQGSIAAVYQGVVSKQNVEENIKTLLAEGQ